MKRYEYDNTALEVENAPSAVTIKLTAPLTELRAVADTLGKTAGSGSSLVYPIYGVLLDYLEDIDG